jgi:hypothetical protein
VVYFRGFTDIPLPNGSYNFIGSYGNPSGTGNGYMYDSVAAVVTTPWLDLRKAGALKTAQAIDYALQGKWTLYGSMDYIGVGNNSAALQKIADEVGVSDSTELIGSFQLGTQDWTDEGYHVQLSAIRTDTYYLGQLAKLSELVFYYEPGDDKVA